MTEYNCYQYAIELGFTEEEARALQASKVGKGQDATVLRRLAKVKNLSSTRPPLPVIAPEPAPDAPQATSSLVTPATDSKPPMKRKRATRTRAKRAIETNGGGRG